MRTAYHDDGSRRLYRRAVRRSGVALAAVLLSVLLAALAPATEGANPCTLVVRVIDPKGVSVPSIAVVELPSDCETLRAMTDSDGEYRLTQPTSGGATLLIIDEARKWEPQPLIGLTCGGVVRIILRPAGVALVPTEARQVLANYAALKLLMSGRACPRDAELMVGIRSRVSRLVLPEDESVRLAYNDVRRLWEIPPVTVSTSPSTGHKGGGRAPTRDVGPKVGLWRIPY